MLIQSTLNKTQKRYAINHDGVEQTAHKQQDTTQKWYTIEMEGKAEFVSQNIFLQATLMSVNSMTFLMSHSM